MQAQGHERTRLCSSACASARMHKYINFLNGTSESMKMTTFATTSAKDFHRLQLRQATSIGSNRPLLRGVSTRTESSICDGIASCAFVTTKRHLPDLRLGRKVCSQLTDFFSDHERFRKQRPDSKAPSKRCGKGYVRGKGGKLWLHQRHDT